MISFGNEVHSKKIIGCLLRSLVQQCIKILSDENNMPTNMEKDCPEFVFNIRGSDVKDQINNICPSIWQCHFSSIGKIFIRSTEFDKNLSQFVNDSKTILEIIYF